MKETFRQTAGVIKGWIVGNIADHIASRQPLVWLLALIAGFAVSAGAIVFREAIGWFQLFWLGDSSEAVASAARAMAPWRIFFGLIGGGLLVGLCLRYLLPSRRTGGVADVIETRAYPGNRIRFREALAQAGVTALSLGAGASAGREGPVVHLGAAIASGLARHFALPDWAIRTLLASGVGAAVSASFNAPIAGVLFAHEVILGHYAVRALVPIVISSVAGTLVSRLWFGDVAAFSIPSYQITSFWEFPAFALLGLVCAMVGILFQVALMASDMSARALRVPLLLLPAIGGVLVAAIAVFFPEVLGVGYEATDKALRNDYGLMFMLSLIVAKTAATAISLGARFGGGVFSPSLYLGAMTGGAFGLIAAALFPQLASSEGLYAILGMGGVAAVVLGAPVSTTVMVFELTGGYALSIALLLTVSIAAGTANALHGLSFVHWQLQRRGLFLSAGVHRNAVRSSLVGEIMTGRAESDPIEIQRAAPGSPSLAPGDSLESALRVFDACGLDRLAVRASDDADRLAGWVTHLAVLRRYNAALTAVADEEHQR